MKGQETLANTRKAAEKQPATLDDILGNVARAERVVPICVRGDLVAQVQELELQAVTAEDEDTNNGRLGSEAQAPKLAKRIKTIEAEMRKYTYEFRFRAVPPKQWADLLAEHPDKKGQLRVDYYSLEFRVAAVAASCVEPEGMADVDGVRRLFAELQAGQCDELFEAAWGVNEQAGKGATSSFIASSILQTSEKPSTTSARLGSPAPSSSDE